MTDNGNKIDFTRYKPPRLIEYLSATCIQVQNNVNFRCPLHDDGDTPDKWSAIVRNNQSMTCYGCGFHGDIYDLCGEITGETNIVRTIQVSCPPAHSTLQKSPRYIQTIHTKTKTYPKPEPIFTDPMALRGVDAWLVRSKRFLP